MDHRRTSTVRIILPILLCISCCLARAAAQVYAYHPQANPLLTVSSNAYPFGSGAPGAMQFIDHVPASALDLSNPFITDVSFFGAQTGTWSSGAVKVGIGHLPDPPPCPFTLPSGPGAPGIGSFTDLTILWDSTTDGALQFPVTQDEWSPLGLPASGRAPFQWNGIDAIGVFIGFNNRSITGGTNMRAHPTVMRTYTYTGSGAPCFQPSGLHVRLHLTCPSPTWQVNSVASSLDVDGASNDSCGPIQVSSCVNLTSTLNASSVNLGLPYEIGISQRPGLPFGGGGQMLQNGEIVNLDLTDPALFFWYGLAFTTPFQPFSASFTYTAPVSASAQMANVDPTLVPALAVSALTEYDAAAASPALNVTPSLGLDGFLQVFLGVPPFCGGPVTFYGTSYTSLFVNANGFVSFTGGDSWWAATPSYWSTLMPRVGVWSDFDSQVTGTVTAGTGNNQVLVNYTLVPENTNGVGFGPQTSFNIEFDTLVGFAAITGFAPGAGHGTATLLGITPGASSGSNASDPGSITFANFLGLGAQLGPGGNNMLYEFNPGGMPGGFGNIVFPGGDASGFVVY